MKVASSFWHEMMFGYDWEESLKLSIAHTETTPQQSTYRISVTLLDDLVRAILQYQSALNVPLQAVLLACYYLFLFKLTENKTDFCMGMVVNNHHRSEFREIIGPFTNL